MSEPVFEEALRHAERRLGLPDLRALGHPRRGRRRAEAGGDRAPALLALLVLLRVEQIARASRGG